MKKPIIVFAGLALLISLTGCPFSCKPAGSEGKSDPVTTILVRNKYAPVVPISDGLCLGDIYKGSPSELIPVLQIDKDLPEVYLHILEVMRSENVSLAGVSGNETFELNADADIIGAAQGQLEVFGAKRFRVNIEDPCAYSISDYQFRTYVYPELVKRDPDANYVGMYIVASLLKAKRIEYDLTNGKGVNIKVSSQDAIQYIANAELGMALDTNEHYKLYTSKPSYIGRKLYKIDANSGYKPQVIRELGITLATNLPESIRVSEAKREGLRRERATLAESLQTKESHMKELHEAQTELSASVQAKETKIEELRKAQASSSKSTTATVQAEKLRMAQVELAKSKAKMEELHEKQAELSKSVLAEVADLNALTTAEAELSRSIRADEAKTGKLQKARAKLAESIVLEEVPREQLRKTGAKLKK